jgi:aminopeptidase YwaD
MLKFDSDRAFRYFNELSFPRLTGTPAEKKAADIVHRWFAEAGLKPSTEVFPVMSYADGAASLAVSGRKYLVSPIAFTGNTPKGGVSGDVLFAENGAAHFLDDAGGKIVMVHGGMGGGLHKRLVGKKAKALLLVARPGYPACSMYYPPESRAKTGAVPTVMVSYNDALDILRRGGGRAKVSVKSAEIRSRSRNIVAVIPGSERPEEWICLGGHYDTIPPGNPGAVDNSAGVACVAEVAAQLARTRPKRTIVFAAFGAEELGILGSFNFMKRRKALKDRFKVYINIDLVGAVLGINYYAVDGPVELRDYFATMAREMGIGMKEYRDPFGSDHWPFNLLGIPSVNFARLITQDEALMHTPLDTPGLVDAAHIAEFGGLALELTDRLANAVELPFEPAMPRDRLESLKGMVPPWMKKTLGI